MSKMKRTASALLAMLFAAAAVTPALAAAEAPAEPSPKEEVIYFNLDASGAVQGAYAVNSFPGGEITDYGGYSELRVLNTEDEINYSDGVVTLSSGADKVYYQGTLENAELPWDILLSYKLGGEDMDPSQLGGASGELEIRFTVTKNAACHGSFYEDYALQANFSLPGGVFSDISAPDATIASVGGDKQLTYTLLPGEGIDTVISASVENFSMPAVSINGIHLNLSVDVDTDGIKDMVSELVSAASQLDSGAAALLGGSNELLDGSAGLLSGADSLHSGIAELDSGVAQLQSGLSAMQSGLGELYSKSPELASGASALSSGLSELSAQLSAFDVNAEIASMLASVAPQIEALTGAGTAAQAAAEGLQSGMSGLLGQAMQAYSQINSAKQANSAASGVIDSMLADPELSEALAGYDLASVKAALEGSTTVMDGVVSTVTGALGGFSSSISELTAALTNLNTSAEALTQSLSGLQAQTGAIAAKVEQLKSGVAALTAGASKLNGGIGAYTGGVAQLVNGFGSVMSGVGQLAEGSRELLSGSSELSSGTAQLYEGVAELCSGAQSMASGAGALHSETNGLDVQAEIDSLLEGIGGNMDAPLSFVSEENGTISSVQFVIQTGEISAPEPEPEPEVQEEEPGFLDRLLALFGL